MSKIKFLNTFAGVGGNTELLDRDKFEVTHIELYSKPTRYLEENFPNDIVLRKNAWRYIPENFRDYDIVWASPSCKTHSRARVFQLSDRYVNGNFELPDERLWMLIKWLKVFGSRMIWIVENVIPFYTSIEIPTALVGRHLVWSNKRIGDKSFEADQIIYKQKGSFDRDRMNPEIGKYIIEQAINDKQTSLEGDFL